MNYLDKVYFNNSVEEYLIATGIIVIGTSIIALFKKTFLLRLKKWSHKTENKIDDYVIDAFEHFVLPVLQIGAFYIGLQYLIFTEWTESVLRNAFTVVLAFYAIRLTSKFLEILLESSTRRKGGGEGKIRQLKGIIVVINIIIWSVGIIFLFDNLGYDVTAAITGLGIGGLAVALAAQTILGDLFNYFVIFFDRPFEIGDFVVVDDKMGDIEYIGIKTTRIKSLSGEQIIIANSDLTSSRLHNFKRMKARRIAFTLGVTYQTTASQLKKIPAIINKIIMAQKDAEVGRCHFFSYGDFSLNFEVIYYVTNPDYTRYMDVQQSINLSIFEAFAEQKIDFAYPTQTVFVEKN